MLGIIKTTGIMAVTLLGSIVSVQAASTFINIREIAKRCAPHADSHTMQFLIQNESGFSPYSIHINGKLRLVRQPKNEEEAIASAKWLLAKGFNFDAGLMQINSANFNRFGLTAQNLFDICTNVHAGYMVLADCYSRALSQNSNEQDALKMALSCYNTGSFSSGFRNGYVQRVINIAASNHNKDVTIKIPELSVSTSEKKSENSSSSAPQTNSVDDLFGPNGTGEQDLFETQKD